MLLPKDFKHTVCYNEHASDMGLGAPVLIPLAHVVGGFGSLCSAFAVHSAELGTADWLCCLWASTSLVLY